MKRRDFVKQVGFVTAGAIAAPFILPSGRLFAASGARKADHVVFCLYAGGVRALDTVDKSLGNLLPNILSGSEPVATDIASTIDPLPSFGTSLQSQGSLFREFRYRQGPTGHYNGHTVAITGKYTDTDLNINARPQSPTIFELYRKHNSPAQTALKSWWVADHLGPFPSLNYSAFPGYGAAYGANYMAPTFLFSDQGNASINSLRTFNSNEQAGIGKIKKFLDQNFSHNFVNGDAGVSNTEADNANLHSWITNMMNNYNSGLTWDPWMIGASKMNNDMRNMYFAEEVIKKYQPELLVVNMQQVDICHFDFTSYCDNLYKADYAVAHLWNTIQSTPGMMNNTVMIIAPEHGRNYAGNNHVDQNGRQALDHTAAMDGSGDQMAREIFCLVLGAPSIVRQGQIIDSIGSNGFGGESIEIASVISNVLGFDSAIPGGMIKDYAFCDLNQAFY